VHTQYIKVQDTTAPVLIGELPVGESNINACKGIDLGEPSEEDIAALFEDNCGEVIVTKTVVELGDDCDWAVMYRYEIEDECGNHTTPIKVYYNGGDNSAPELTGTLPEGISGLQCLSENPGAPKLIEIQDAFTDNCGEVIVTPLEPIIEGDDCGWTATYTYTISDTCGNYAENVVITHSGGDDTPPQLVGEIPIGANSLDLCIDADLGEPSEEDIAALYYDNCSEVTVEKLEKTYGDDCEWIRVFEYVAYDACGNAADIIKVNYQGGDQSAPTLKEECELDEAMIGYTENGADCPADASTSLNIGDSFGIYDYSWTVGGLTLNDFNKTINCFQDNCTAEEDLVYTVVDINEAKSDCSTTIILVLDVSDNCGNVYEGFEVTFIIVDNTAPVIECPKSVDFGINPELAENGLPIGLVDKATYTDNCQYGGETQNYTDNISENVGDPTQYSTSMEYTLTRTFVAEDACGNKATCDVIYTWTIETSEITRIKNPEQQVSTVKKMSTLDFTAHPVPFDKEVNITYNFDFDTDVTIQLFDGRGLLIFTKTNNRYIKGSRATTTFDLSRHANQMFYVKLITNKGIVTKKIISSSVKQY